MFVDPVSPYDQPWRQHQRRANLTGQMRESPDIPGTPAAPTPPGQAQNAAAQAATQPDYQLPYMQPQTGGGDGQATSYMNAPSGGVSGGTFAHPYGAAGTMVASSYQQHLGRPPSMEELGGYMAGGRDVNGVLGAIDQIRGSEEAQQRARQEQQRQEQQAASDAYMESHRAQWEPYLNTVPARMAAAGPPNAGLVAALQTAMPPGLAQMYGQMTQPQQPPATGSWDPALRQPPASGGTAVAAPPMFAPGEPDPNAPAPPATPAAGPLTGWGQYVGNRNAALDPTKMALADEALSPKYAIARVLSHFDPTQGFTPDVINALNTLGIGTFTNQNDVLSVSGAVDPRFEDTLTSDMIRNMGGPDARWGGWGSVVPGQPRGGGLDPALLAAQGLFSGPTASTVTGGSDYTQSILRYLAQQLGLANVLGAR